MTDTHIPHHDGFRTPGSEGMDSGSKQRGVQMKKKMFAMLTISFMVMAAFGAVAIFDADTDADEFLVINEASGTVSYIPDKINVSVNGTVSFKPTVNWIAGGHGGFYTDISVGVTSENIDIFTVSYTDNVVSVVGVSTGTDKELTVMVTSETYIGDSATGTPVITKEVSYGVDVNVYPKLELSLSSVEESPTEIPKCYFGEEYIWDLTTGSSPKLTGSGQYAMSVSDLPNGLYVLGATVLGMAYEGNFETGTAKEMKITVVDLKTGSVKVGYAIMDLSEYVVETKLIDGEAESKPNYVDQVLSDASPKSVTLRYTVTGHETAPVMNVKIDGISVDTPGIPDGKDYYELDLTDTAKIIGKHVITFNYTANGYTYNALSYELFVVGGMGFVVPNPEMVVTLVS